MNVVLQNHSILVGDADGADVAVQRFLFDNCAQDVTVYCTGDVPRNNIGNWKLRPVVTYHKPGSRSYFTAKDIEMAAESDHGLMIWDAKSTGTLSNVLELLSRKKNALVFIQKVGTFEKVLTASDLDRLLEYMTEPAKLSADTKINLFERLDALRCREKQFALLAEKAAANIQN